MKNNNKPIALLMFFQPNHKFKTRKFFLFYGINYIGSHPSCQIFLQASQLPQKAAFIHIRGVNQSNHSIDNHDSTIINNYTNYLLTLKRVSKQCRIQIPTNLNVTRQNNYGLVNIDNQLIEYVIPAQIQFRINKWKGIFKALQGNQHQLIKNILNSHLILNGNKMELEVTQKYDSQENSLSPQHQLMLNSHNLKKFKKQIKSNQLLPIKQNNNEIQSTLLMEDIYQPTLLLDQQNSNREYQQCQPTLLVQQKDCGTLLIQNNSQNTQKIQEQINDKQQNQVDKNKTDLKQIPLIKFAQSVILPGQAQLQPQESEMPKTLQQDEDSNPQQIPQKSQIQKEPIKQIPILNKQNKISKSQPHVTLFSSLNMKQKQQQIPFVSTAPVIKSKRSDSFYDLFNQLEGQDNNYKFEIKNKNSEKQQIPSQKPEEKRMVRKLIMNSIDCFDVNNSNKIGLDNNRKSQPICSIFSSLQGTLSSASYNNNSNSNSNNNTFNNLYIQSQKTQQNGIANQKSVKKQKKISFSGFKPSEMQKLIAKNMNLKIIESQQQDYDILLIPATNAQPKLTIRLLKALLTKKQIYSQSYINNGTGKIFGKIFGHTWTQIISAHKGKVTGKDISSIQSANNNSTELKNTFLRQQQFFLSQYLLQYRQLIQLCGGRVLDRISKNLSKQNLNIIVSTKDLQLFEYYGHYKKWNFYDQKTLQQSLLLAKWTKDKAVVTKQFFSTNNS